MIELVEKPEAVLATWLATMWTEYHADLLAAGMSVAEADRNVERNRTNLLDGERPSAGQHILDVVSDGAVVGTLWLGHQPGQHEWFIYDIAIDEERRGTGLGRATMLAAEDPNVAQALLLLSYPLHPPGKPAEVRTAHFPDLRTPALFAHGTRDAFGTIEEMRDALKAIPARADLLVVEGAPHGLPAKDTPLVVSSFREFIR